MIKLDADPSRFTSEQKIEVLFLGMKVSDSLSGSTDKKMNLITTGNERVPPETIFKPDQKSEEVLRSMRRAKTPPQEAAAAPEESATDAPKKGKLSRAKDFLTGRSRATSGSENKEPAAVDKGKTPRV